MKGKLRVNPKIRRWILVAGPFIFSIFSSFVYILIFSPVKGTPDYSNIIFVFFAAIGWSSHILYGNREMIRASYYLSVISFIVPFFVLEVFRLYPYNVYQGRIILALILAANLWLAVIYKNLRLKALNPSEEDHIS